jgi:sec-independent protein translocase protein TatC
MLLTPPDVISQTLLAIPMWLLFELGLYFSGWFLQQKQKIAGGSVTGGDYKPLSDAEMDAEMDRIEKDGKE